MVMLTPSMTRAVGEAAWVNDDLERGLDFAIKRAGPAIAAATRSAVLHATVFDADDVAEVAYVQTQAAIETATELL